MKKRSNLRTGFTLVEVLISVSIFTIVALVAIASVITANDVAKKTQNIRNAFDNLNFAIESMARSIRLGRDYKCPADTGNECAVGRDSISFTFGPEDSSAEIITYKLVGNKLVRKKVVGGNAIEAELTSDKVINIASLTFIVCKTNTCSSGASIIQPRVVILIKGETSGKENVKSIFSIQTSVTQRKLQ